MKNPTTVNVPANLHPDPELRETLLSYFLDTLTASELSGWLAEIGQESRGTAEEKRQRIRANTKYLTMPAAEFPRQTENYLEPYSPGHLGDLCEVLGLPSEGTKEARYRRIMRQVHYREGWLPQIPAQSDSGLNSETVMPFLGYFPILNRNTYKYERDFYPMIRDELQEVFGADAVFEQQPIAHGSILKIDFHVGDPHGHGVGVEVKMPTSNSDIQRTLGQIDQYQSRYGTNLILMVLNDFLKSESERFLLDELLRKGIPTVLR